MIYFIHKYIQKINSLNKQILCHKMFCFVLLFDLVDFQITVNELVTDKV